MLGPGETVLLYTDGLVERREEGIASRLEQPRAAKANAPQSLDACLEHVMERLAGGDMRLDDIALLALSLR